MRTLKEMKEFRSKHGSIGALDFIIDRMEKRQGVSLNEMSNPESLPYRYNDDDKNKISISLKANQIYIDYLNKAKSRNARSLRASVLRMGSIEAREIYAAKCSNGLLNITNIENLLIRVSSLSGESRDALISEMKETLDSNSMIELAEIIALQDFSAFDRHFALQIFDLFSEYSDNSNTKKLSRILCSFLVESGNEYKVRKILNSPFKPIKSVRDVIEIDLINPFLKSAPCSYSNWAEKLNLAFFGKLEPVRFKMDIGEYYEHFDRVRCSATSSYEGPLVTVIIASFKPGSHIYTAVNSILNQSYSNLELIVVDDASGPEFSEIYRKINEMDSRVRVLTQPVNQGTYAARNFALKYSKGEFFTCQDSDDWSHPRRIEYQVKPLLVDSEVPATISYALQVKPNLVLSDYNRAPVARNASSLLVRKSLYSEELGAFHHVRKGADTEFAARLELVTGRKIKELKEFPLSLVRRGEGSLSRSEFKPGWRDPARVSYRTSWEFWHRQIANEKACGKLEPSVSNQFPVPKKFRVPDSERDVEYFDVVFVGVWSDYGGPQKSMLQEIKALKLKGLKVAICHLDSLRFMSSNPRPLADNIVALLHTNELVQVFLSDNLDVGLIILRYPPILHFLNPITSNWSAKHGWIVANQAPHELDGSDVRYDVNFCTNQFRVVFKCSCTWVPQGPSVRSIIEESVPIELISQFNSPGILSIEDWWIERDNRLIEAPIIGRYSRDTVMKYPNTSSELMTLYGSPKYKKVLLMGGIKSCQAIMGDTPIPSNWDLLPYGAMPVRSFLRKIDFFVYYDNKNIVEAFGRSILEAAASGAIVIVPPKYAKVFGECAVYAEPNDVVKVINSFCNDPQLQKLHREKVKLAFLENYSYESFYQLYISQIEKL